MTPFFVIKTVVKRSHSQLNVVVPV